MQLNNLKDPQQVVDFATAVKTGLGSQVNTLFDRQLAVVAIPPIGVSRNGNPIRARLLLGRRFIRRLSLTTG